MDSPRLPRRLLLSFVSLLAFASLSTGLAQGAPPPSVSAPSAQTAAAAARRHVLR